MTAHRVHVHTSRQPIRWGDMDALGHVNNTVYFRFMEQARIEWLYAHRGEGSHAGTRLRVTRAENRWNHAKSEARRARLETQQELERHSGSATNSRLY